MNLRLFLILVVALVVLYHCAVFLRQHIATVVVYFIRRINKVIMILMIQAVVIKHVLSNKQAFVNKRLFYGGLNRTLCA